jgi:hypothetical protein
MLRIADSSGSSRHASTDAEDPPRLERLPSNQTVLSLSWLNGSFRALAVHKGVIDGSWERPGVIDDIASFPSLLHDAVANTGFKGTTVSLVLAHPRFVQQLLEAPPTKSSGVVRFLESQIQLLLYLGMPPDGQPAMVHYIQRQVQNLKTFEGDAAWCMEQTMPIKGSNGILLHLFPKKLLGLLLQASAKSQLYLTSVLPPTAILRNQLADLPIQDDDVALIVAETGGTSTVIVGRRDGQILLGRILTGTWNENASRFTVDLKRTLLFVNQQFGANIIGAWLFGPGATEHVEELQGELELPVHISPTPWHQFYWAREALLVPAEHLPNLISRELQEAPRRKLLRRVVALAAILLLLASLLTTGFLESMVGEEQGNLHRLRAREQELQTRHKQLQALAEELTRKQTLVSLISESALAPVPGWLLGYLGDVVPPELLLTNIHVRRDSNLWRVSLSGVLQPTTNTATGLLFSNALSRLTNQLISGPFHLRLAGSETASTNPAASTGVGPSLADWVAQMSLSAQRGPGPTRFTLEGTMR